jgi:methyl-accepting chemotaxis protein
VSELQSSLGSIVGDVRGVSAQILDVSSTLAEYADQAVARNAEAVASLKHCVATVAEITTSVDCAQSTVEDAVRLSDANAAAANSGQQAVERQLATMDELARSSRKIGEFTDVIGSISFQTNILALNAAVEAARAGEAGRGFAVVATEVRALADRAAAAGKEIGRLIAANAERVERSVKISVETGEKMTSLVANAQQMNRLLELIAKSAESQNTSTRGVNASLQTLDRGSGQGTERATQTAANAARMLKGFAAALADRVATFRI